MQNVPSNLPESLSLCLYRVAQECLRNVAKHAGPATVEVALTSTEHEISLSVADYGSGFDWKKARPGPGLGLVSMEERVNLAGGTYSIRSRPGTGTRVEVHIPLRRETP